MKVLVIDDEPLIADIFAQFLELLGHEADVTVDGRDGLARFDPLVHEMVITDFLMPGLTGFQLAQAIRARGCTTPIVMISGSADQGEERQARELGLRFLHKPLSFAQFAAAMAEVVEYSGAAQ